jgi:hypothetical protein
VIIYDLKCKSSHKFEGWFKDIDSFEKQKVRNLISCPVCGDADVNVIMPSLKVVGKNSRSIQADEKDLSAAKTLQSLYKLVNENFDDVGDRFAEVALKIHRGEEETRNIKGTTTKEDETMLSEEGIKFIKIPFPKFNS